VGGLRFSQIQKRLKLNPTEVNRAVKFLRNGLWIVPRTLPAKGIVSSLNIAWGNAEGLFLELFDSFVVAAARRSADLGAAEVKELQYLAR